jgi:hypothetical protein
MNPYFQNTSLSLEGYLANLKLHDSLPIKNTPCLLLGTLPPWDSTSKKTITRFDSLNLNQNYKPKQISFQLKKEKKISTLTLKRVKIFSFIHSFIDGTVI